MNQRRIGLSGLMREPCPGLGAQSTVDDPPPPLSAVRREGADLTVAVAVVRCVVQPRFSANVQFHPGLSRCDTDPASPMISRSHIHTGRRAPFSRIPTKLSIPIPL